MITRLKKLIEFISIFGTMWHMRNNRFVFVYPDSYFFDLPSHFGLRFEVEDSDSSDEFLRGYYKGVESALFDCGIPKDVVFSNTDYLKQRRRFINYKQNDNILS